MPIHVQIWGSEVALSEVDRKLLERCLAQAPRAWEDFTDRFLGLVVHVVNHTAESRMVKIGTQDAEDLVSDVFMAFIRNDFAILRNFRGEASLATYLTVVARRVVVGQLKNRRFQSPAPVVEQKSQFTEGSDPENRITDKEQVERLLSGLNGPEADVVRMYHLEGRSYEEIGSKVGMPANSVGPTLSRAREKMRRNSVDA